MPTRRAPRARGRRGGPHRPAPPPRHLPRHRRADRRGAAHGRRGHPPRLRLPRRERRFAEAVRDAGCLHRPAARGDPRDGRTRSSARSARRPRRACPSCPARTRRRPTDDAAGAAAARDRLPGHGQGVGRRRRQGHARRALAERARRGAAPARSARRSPPSATRRIYLEKHIDHAAPHRDPDLRRHPRQVIHLGERECSIQRRHQKVIEESALARRSTPAMRAAWARPPSRLARAVGYINAGTVEFIVDPDGDFYFLEDEHAAAGRASRHRTGHRPRSRALADPRRRGEPLPLRPRRPPLRGHAVEARIYAEDPASRISAGLAPSPAGARRMSRGRARGRRNPDRRHRYPPLRPAARQDQRPRRRPRDEALRRLEHALARTVLLGLRTNQDYLRRVLLHPAHLAGQIRHRLRRAPRRRATHPGGSAHSRPLRRRAGGARRHHPPAARAPRRAPVEPMAKQSQSLAAPTLYPAARRRRPAIGIRVTPAAGNHLAVSIVSENQERTLDMLVHARSGGDLAVEIDGRLAHSICAEAAPGEWWVRVSRRDARSALDAAAA